MVCNIHCFSQYFTSTNAEICINTIHDNTLLYDLIVQTDWAFLASIDDVQSFCSMFDDKFYNLLDVAVSKRSSVSHARRCQFLPWFMGDVVKSITKASFQKKYIKFRRMEYYNLFKHHRSNCEREACKSLISDTEKSQKILECYPEEEWFIVNLLCHDLC